MRSFSKPSSGSEVEPRADLLHAWKDALQCHDETWKVKWTPLTHGKDKRLWIRFAQLKEDTKDANFQEKCRTHLLAWAKLRGYAVTNSYFNPGGVTLCLAAPIDVEQILARGSLEKIPGIPFSVQPVRGRQVEIENTFELAIDYDLENLHDMLRDWLVDNFQYDDITTLAGTRSDSSEPEMFIFHMTTWKATCDVLSDSVCERFKTDFKAFEMLQPPQLLHNLNTSGLDRKPGSFRKDLARGASMVTDGLDKLQREFNAYKETNSQLHQATQLQLAATTSTLSILTNLIEGMENHLVSTQRAILFQSQELSLSRAMTDLRSNTMSLRVNLILETDETKKQEICSLLVSLVNEEQRLNDELAKTSHDFLTVINSLSAVQLLSGDISSSSNPANEDERERVKRRKLNDSSDVLPETNVAPPQIPRIRMQVDNNIGIQVDNNIGTQDQSNVVRNCHSSSLNTLMAANNNIPDISMKPVFRP